MDSLHIPSWRISSSTPSAGGNHPKSQTEGGIKQFLKFWPPYCCLWELDGKTQWVHGMTLLPLECLRGNSWKIIQGLQPLGRVLRPLLPEEFCPWISPDAGTPQNHKGMWGWLMIFQIQEETPFNVQDLLPVTHRDKVIKVTKGAGKPGILPHHLPAQLGCAWTSSEQSLELQHPPHPRNLRLEYPSLGGIQGSDPELGANTGQNS